MQVERDLLDGGKFFLDKLSPHGYFAFMHVYEVCARTDRRGFDLISDALPFGRLWYDRAEDTIGYAKFISRSHGALIRVFDESVTVIETHEHGGNFQEP